MKNKKLQRVIFILIPIIVLFVYVLLDYFNVFSLIGIRVKNINIAVLGLVVNAVVVIVLYIISFYYIDNKQNEKDANSRSTARILLQNVYKECKENIQLLDDREFIARYIIPKTDGTKLDSENKVIQNLKTTPFSAEETIMALSIGGHLLLDDMAIYLNVKNEYQRLVSLKITFYDLISPQTNEQRELYDDIMNRNRALILKLVAEIERLSKEMGETNK